MDFNREGTPHEKLKIGIPGIDLDKIEDIEFEDIREYDAPDYCDAFISYASYEGRDLTQEELEWISEIIQTGFMID